MTHRQSLISLTHQDAMAISSWIRCILLILVSGNFSVSHAASAGDSVPKGETIGHGNCQISILPRISSPSVKNGGMLTISAIVKAVAGVSEVKAEIRDPGRIIESVN